MSPRRAVTRRIRGLEDLRPLQRIELGIGPKRHCYVEDDRGAPQRLNVSGMDQRHECKVARWFPGDPEEPTNCQVVSSAFRSEEERLEAWQKTRDEFVARWEADGRLRPPWAERVLTPLVFD